MRRVVLRHREKWLLSCALLLLTGSGCVEDEAARPQEAVAETQFVSRVVSAQPGGDSALVAYLKTSHLPVWRDLHDDGLLLEASVFALTQMDSVVREDPNWDFLILVQLGQAIDAQEFLEREAASNPPFTVLRTEALTATPRSFYQTPNAEHRDRIGEVEFLVEFIAVDETSHALAKYRDLMSTYFGPANGSLVSDGILFDFIAMETTEVIDQVQGTMSWNQLHVSGDLPEHIDLDWDSLYTDLFERLFSSSLDSIWAQLPSTEESPGDYSGRLLKELHVS